MCDHHLILFLLALCSAGCMFTRRLISSFPIFSILVFPAAFLRHLISVVVNICLSYKFKLLAFPFNIFSLYLTMFNNVRCVLHWQYICVQLRWSHYYYVHCMCTILCWLCWIQCVQLRWSHYYYVHCMCTILCWLCWIQFNSIQKFFAGEGPVFTLVK